jgi:hypothetical protein
MSDVIVYRVMLDCVKEFYMVAYSRLNEAGALDVRRHSEGGGAAARARSRSRAAPFRARSRSCYSRLKSMPSTSAPSHGS